TNTNHAKAMLSATIAVFFTVAPTGETPYMGRARFELRTGHSRVTTPNEDPYLAVTAKRTDGSQHQTSLVSYLQLSVRQFQGRPSTKRFEHIGLYDRRHVRCVPLTTTHCHLRLAWSREHALCSPQQWSCVMFFDESRLVLQSDSRRTLIWRVPGTRYHEENSIERHRYGGAGWYAFGEELVLVAELTCMFRV
ncbi:HTH_Tnp_Tc3_2 domain-containing protein, partial [Trichonephila clavipes]